MADYTISFYDSIASVQDAWESRTDTCTFFSKDFYAALEQSPPSGTSFWYGLVHDGERNVGYLYYQLKKIELDKSLRLTVAEDASWLTRTFTQLKRLLARQVRYYTLVGGNMTLTGTYGHNFEQIVSIEDQWTLIPRAADELIAHLKGIGIKVSGVLLKDYEDSNRPTAIPEKYAQFEVQPNMIMEIPTEWQTTEDYMNAMKSKYRVRVRRARKKAEGLHMKVLTTDEIIANKAQIASLYQYVSDGAGFNLFTLPDDYFSSLQQHLSDKMKFTAYYDGEEMVGFYTSIKNHNELDAHFLGYEPQCNQECQLYLNMLYNLVDEAIEYGSHHLVLSRTAMEIKSSVGAEAKPMYLYMKTTNPLLNRILSKALDYFVPKEEWTPRGPFG